MASTKAPFIKNIGAHNSLPLKVYKLSLKINLPMEKIDGFYFWIPTLTTIMSLGTSFCTLLTLRIKSGP